MLISRDVYIYIYRWGCGRHVCIGLRSGDVDCERARISYVLRSIVARKHMMTSVDIIARGKE